MNKLLTLSLLGMLLLSCSASAAWDKLWDQRVDAVIVKHGITIENPNQPYPTGEIPTDQIRLFATSNRTGDIYRYSGTIDRWTKVGNPGKKFVATGGVGSRLYGLDPAGMGVYEFTGTPMDWTQVGGPAADIYAGGSKLYTTNPEDDWEIYEYAGTPWEWEQIGQFRTGYVQILDYVAAGDGYRKRPDFPYSTYPSNLYMLAEKTYDGRIVGVIFKYTGTHLGWDLISAGNLDAGDLDVNAIYGGGFNSGAVYARDQYTREIYEWSEDGDVWEKLIDPAKIFVADQYIDGSSVHNLLYRLNADGALWMYDDEVGSWTQIETGGFRNPLKEIYTAGGELYGVTEADYIYKYVP